MDDLCESITDVYDLTEYISDRLEFHYVSHSNGAVRKSKNVKLKGTDLFTGHKSTDVRGYMTDVGLQDLHLGVRFKAGDEVVEDVTCDSDYMLRIMPKVGKAIREAYFWVGKDDKIYLVLDSAGGHGTNEAIAKYKADLERDYKIILVHQIPQSPDTNALDLGIWMSLQSAVEKVHRLRRGDPEALHQSVIKVWDKVASEEAFVKVFDRLKKNYALIKKNGGGNDLVEEYRGKKGTQAIAEFEEDIGIALDVGLDVGGEIDGEEDGLVGEEDVGDDGGVVGEDVVGANDVGEDGMMADM